MYLSLDGSLVVAKTPVLRDLQKVAEAGREATTNGLLVHGLGSSKVGVLSVSFWLKTSWRAKRELHRRKNGSWAFDGRVPLTVSSPFLSFLLLLFLTFSKSQTKKASQNLLSLLPVSFFLGSL